METNMAQQITDLKELRKGDKITTTQQPNEVYEVTRIGKNKKLGTYIVIKPLIETFVDTNRFGEDDLNYAKVARATDEDMQFVKDFWNPDF